MKFTRIKVFSVLSLAGCFGMITGCTPLYVDHTPGPKAQIQNSDNVGIFKNASRCTGWQHLKGAPWFGNHIGYTTVPANTMVTLIGVYEDNPYYYCTPAAFSFTPQPNNQYIATYEPKKHQTGGFFSNPVCAAKVYNVTQKRNVPVIIRDYKNGLMSGKCADAYANQ